MKKNLQFWLEYFFNTSNATKSRLAWVDYAKGIALILVAYRHILIGFERAGLPIHISLLKANEMFFSFRMPLFFILSGVFISHSLSKRGWIKLIKIKWETLLYPYLLWCIIQITLQIIFSKYTNADRTFRSYAYILTNLDALDQMWYLFALFNVSVVYIILKSKARLNIWTQLIIGIISYYLSTIFNHGPIREFLYFYPYFTLGDLISKYLLDKKYYKIYSSNALFLVLLPFFVISQWYFLRHEEIEYKNIFIFSAIALIGCAFMLNICFKLANDNKLIFLKIVGFHSLYIYILHVSIAFALRLLLSNVLGINNTIILLIINLPVAIIISIIIYNIIVRNGGWYLFVLNKERINKTLIYDKIMSTSIIQNITKEINKEKIEI